MIFSFGVDKFCAGIPPKPEYLASASLSSGGNRTMTELGIANAYMNQPCDVALLTKEMQLSLPINHEFPTLIVRIGYADPYALFAKKRY